MYSSLSTYCIRCQFAIAGSCAETCMHGELVVVVGTHLHLLGPFVMTHVTRWCAYLHCVLGVIIYQFVPFVTIIPYLSWMILQTTLCLHAVILFPMHIPLPSTINARIYSYFVHVCFMWNNPNKLSFNLLKIDNHSSIHHAALNHFCNTLSNYYC